MKIVNRNDGWLTNFEVYTSLLVDQSRIAEKELKKPKNAEQIQNFVLRYLKDYTPVESMNAESIKKTLEGNILEPLFISHFSRT